jgi:hypothetical protein
LEAFGVGETINYVNSPWRDGHTLVRLTLLMCSSFIVTCAGSSLQQPLGAEGVEAYPTAIGHAKSGSSSCAFTETV